MEGEIITLAEMREAKKHGDDLRVIIAQDPRLTRRLQPTMDFLDRLAWKGMH